MVDRSRDARRTATALIESGDLGGKRDASTRGLPGVVATTRFGVAQPVRLVVARRAPLRVQVVHGVLVHELHTLTPFEYQTDQAETCRLSDLDREACPPGGKQRCRRLGRWNSVSVSTLHMRLPMGAAA